MLPQEGNNNQKVFSVYVIILRVIAAISIIMGIILGRKFVWGASNYYDYNYAVAWGWSIAGVINALILWGLSIVAEACHKYINQK